MSRRSGVVYAALSAVLFGAATPVAKRLLGDVPPQVLAGLFYAGAALCLAPALARSRAPGAGFAFPKDARNRRYLAGAILFGGVLGPVLLLLGLRLAQAASVSMLLNLETTATAVVGVLLFREHLGRWAWLGNAGVLAAGVMLGLEGGAPGLLGGLLVAGAALCWGLDNNLTALIDGVTPLASTFWKGACAGSVNLAIGLALTPTAPSPSWAAALVVGGLSYGVSIALYISAAQMLGATRSQMIFATSPFVGVALAVAWLGEPMSTAHAVAFVLMVASLTVLMLDQHDHPHGHEAGVHTHSHRHDDGHHDHAHEGLLPGHRHTHEHVHRRLEHAHPHWPDLHHRHEHEARTRR